MKHERALRAPALAMVAMLSLAACEATPDQTGSTSSGNGGAGEGGATDPGVEVIVDTSALAHVDLASGAVVDGSTNWDLRFDGLDIFTNGGVSGAGKGAAFGPLDAELFDTDEVPADIPFLTADGPGGPFLDWYLYDPSEHVLYSRFHTFGIRRGDEQYKLQILGFYGEAEGAPVAALYRVRFARADDDEFEKTVELDSIDGTAGGQNPTDADTSACLRFSTGAVTPMTPAEAAKSSDWDVCFRRAEIFINGGASGPGGVTAVDLQAAASSAETLDDAETWTADNRLASFEDVTLDALNDPSLVYKADGVVSAFTDHWLVPGSSPRAPTDATFLVAGAEGIAPYFVRFESFEGAADDSVGKVHLRVKKLNGSLP